MEGGQAPHRTRLRVLLFNKRHFELRRKPFGVSTHSSQRFTIGDYESETGWSGTDKTRKYFVLLYEPRYRHSNRRVNTSITLTSLQIKTFASFADSAVKNWNLIVLFIYFNVSRSLPFSPSLYCLNLKGINTNAHVYKQQSQHGLAQTMGQLTVELIIMCYKGIM